MSARALLPIAGLAVLCAACAAPQAPQGAGSAPVPAPAPTGTPAPGPTPAPAPADAEVLSVGALVARAAAYRGQFVNASGAFAGWSGPCRGAPPRRRSDWMLVDGTACLYVSGPLPAGIVAPPDTASIGRPVRIRGQLLISDDGRPYLLQTVP